MTARTLFDGPKDSVVHVDRRRCLYMREDLPAVLSLSPEQIGTLIDTGQLTAILICGEERFDSREVSAFIDSYIRVNRRRADNDKYR